MWDVDNNEFIEYGMGLRAVTLGHAYPSVVEAAYRQMRLGSNFTRPAILELEYAEQLVQLIEGAEQIKFCKDGSSATTAAVKLARAHTGRDRVVLCADHPFYSYDDWFIGTTAMAAGIPQAVRELTHTFRYNNLESLQRVFDQYPGEIACVIMEPARVDEPQNNFLQQVKNLCHRNGALFILDEMITGFRWNLQGAQKTYNVVPDLSTFGKGIANGFSVAALMGRRDIMQLGGLNHDKARVFLLSATHGAEAHALAAGLETLRVYREWDVVNRLYRQGTRLADGIQRSIDELHLNDYVQVLGRPVNLIYATKDQQGERSQPFRTLMLQELIRRGVIAPSLVVSFAHTDADIDQTIDIFSEALYIYRRALNEGIEKYLVGRPVKPVFRTYN